MQYLTATESMLVLVALWIDAFEYEQLLTLTASETPNRIWEPADLANFVDIALADVNLYNSSCYIIVIVTNAYY